MRIELNYTETLYGESHVVTATKDEFHRTLVREFYSYDDAYKFCVALLSKPLDKDTLSLFKRKGI